MYTSDAVWRLWLARSSTADVACNDTDSDPVGLILHGRYRRATAGAPRWSDQVSDRVWG